MHAAPAAELSCDALFDRCRVVDLLQRSYLLLSDVLEGEAVHPMKPTLRASPTGRLVDNSSRWLMSFSDRLKPNQGNHGRRG